VHRVRPPLAGERARLDGAAHRRRGRAGGGGRLLPRVRQARVRRPRLDLERPRQPQRDEPNQFRRGNASAAAGGLLVGGSVEKVRNLWWLYRSVGRPVQPPPGLPARIIPCRGDQLPRPLDHHLPWRRRRWKRPKPSLELERDRPFPCGARQDVRALHTSPVRALLIDAERRRRSPCIVDRAGTNPFAHVTSRRARDGLHALRHHDTWILWRGLLLVATTYPRYSWGERVAMAARPVRALAPVTAPQPGAQLYVSVLLSLQSCALTRL
jgi:hypothetical protein